MDVILIGGLWLTADVWREVAEGVRARGHRVVPLALPGQGDGNQLATFEDQVATVLAAVDGTDGKPLVIGHSAAATLAWLAADRRPDRVAGVGLIGGFPPSDGTTYADFFEPVDGQMAFPGWEAFEGPDFADLDEATRARMEAAMVPVPVGVSSGTVQYADPRRSAVPVTLICPEFGPDEAREWIASGDLPELAAATALDYVDIDSGHWPMTSTPQELATILADLADRHTAAA
ncbi:alpha/beta hydrolase [Ornithinimicrobium sp. F0845]|uniref:alpha/beta fold hydrolase n=1 Tax=Ornithinimicrobium sp. F0845 TaxID=2926412 RepID=UPI001FF3726B|nr:alpha/beta hydrolase [Ornithinimicrobium sp. F0845]MCK0114098.1 alpha/beta hydrolase [Ornithinimicrobium sp. F0845]